MLSARAYRLLTFRRVCLWASLLVILYAAAYVHVLANGQPPLNASGEPIGGDYIAFHTAGRLVLLGEAAHLYDHTRVSAVQESLLQDTVPGFYDAFRNPPFFALVFAPLATLELLPGYALWSLLSLFCLGLSIWLLSHEVVALRSRPVGAVVVVCGFAPVYFGLIDGQNSTVALLLYVLIYRALARRQERAAGALAGLGLFKPQLFLILPLVFIATSRRRAL